MLEMHNEKKNLSSYGALRGKKIGASIFKCQLAIPLHFGKRGWNERQEE